MKLIIIADAFPPMRSSAAVHMYELAIELIKQGHKVTVIIPVTHIRVPLRIEYYNGFRLVSVASLKTKEVSSIRRTIAEFISPYVVYHRLKSSSIIDEIFDGIIWYSPTIFFGPLICRLKLRYGCSTYLVLRDMFPDWAVDLRLIKKGFLHFFFKRVEFYQYKMANCIGIQSPGNFKYFNVGNLKQFKSKVELLWSWVTPVDYSMTCSIDLKKTHLVGRMNFIYAGNMGIAQDVDFIISLATLYEQRLDIGFVFVGRGSEYTRLKAMSYKKNLSNTVFFDEISPIEIPALYSQCKIGLVALDLRHKSSNIPGKFLSYMDSGLPVLARVNAGNDLVEMIDYYQVGASYVGSDVGDFMVEANRLIGIIQNDQNLPIRCKNLARTLFSTKNAANQIVNALRDSN